MALPRTIEGKEQAKFRECPDGSNQTVVATQICQNDGETIKVEITNEGNSKLIYSESSSIAIGVETLINTYTVPVGKCFKLKMCHVSGTNVSIFKVKINGSTISTKRIWWNSWNADFLFNDEVTDAGDVIEVYVTNNSATAMVGDYESNIQGNEYDV